MNYDQYIGREVPANVAVCPICGAPLVIEDITEWDTDSELPTEEGTDFVCKSEPDIDSDDFSDWVDWHYQMPYVDWLPLNEPVHKWLTGVIVDDIIRSVGYDPDVVGVKYAELARRLIEAHKPPQVTESNAGA